MRTLIALFALLASPFSANAATPPGFDSAKWDQLVAKVALVGMPGSIADYETRTFSNLQPADKTQPHLAEYFSTMGVFDSAHRYNALYVSAVSENWSKDGDGNWVIDQWIWQVDLRGNLKSVYHGILVETANGTVLDVRNAPAGAADSPEELQRWGAKLAEWLAFKPYSVR